MWMKRRKPAGAVNLGGIYDIRGDHHSAGEKYHCPERHPFPDIGDDVGPEREPRVEPQRAVDPDSSKKRLTKPSSPISIQWNEMKA